MMPGIIVRKTRTEERERRIAVSFPIYTRVESRVGPQSVLVVAERFLASGWRTTVTHECTGDGTLRRYRERFEVAKVHCHQSDLAGLFDCDFHPINRTSADVFDALAARAAAFIADDQRGDRPDLKAAVDGFNARNDARSDVSGSIYEWNPDIDQEPPEMGVAPRAERP